MSEKLPQTSQNDEIDLGQLFKMIGKAFTNVFNFFGKIFNSLFLAFVWFVFFIKKHFIKLVIAAILGVVLAIVLEKTSEPFYSSSIIVKQNYDTGEDLYNIITYYNALVKQENITALGEKIGIPSNEASSIKEFKINPIISENENIKEYDNYFKQLDTIVAKNVNYELFIKNKKTSDFEFQKIIINSKEPKGFNSIFKTIVEDINSNEYFKKEQAKELEQLKGTKAAISKALTKADTLQNVYQRAILQLTKNKNESEARITIANGNGGVDLKEFELYKKDLELRKQLVDIQKDINEKEYIIEIVSSNQESGTIDDKKEFFGNAIDQKIYYSILLMTITFVILLGVNFIKFLEKYKDKV